MAFAFSGVSGSDNPGDLRGFLAFGANGASSPSSRGRFLVGDAAAFFFVGFGLGSSPSAVSFFFLGDLVSALTSPLASSTRAFGALGALARFGAATRGMLHRS